MITLILIFMVFGFFTIPLMVKFDVRYKQKMQHKNKQPKVTPFLIWVAICAILATIVLGVPIVQQNVAIGDAQVIATFDQEKLYYDEKIGVYFTTETQDWSVAPIVVRNIVDKETALDIITKSKQYEQLKEDLTKFYE